MGEHVSVFTNNVESVYYKGIRNSNLDLIFYRQNSI